LGERHKRSPWDERISSNDAIGSGRFASHCWMALKRGELDEAFGRVEGAAESRDGHDIPAVE